MEITRIVRLVFEPQHVATFVDIYRSSYQLIRYSQGCNHLHLMRDHDNENIYYTYSKWNSHEDLEEYRKSELFSQTWARTKVLFADKPQAFSIVEVD
jgi:quinol monooxygenase YgiN